MNKKKCFPGSFNVGGLISKKGYKIFNLNVHKLKRDDECLFLHSVELTCILKQTWSMYRKVAKEVAYKGRSRGNST